jgi:polyphosphate kinase
VSSNLDEFFMVRVAGLKRRIHVGDTTPGADGLSAGETLAAVSARVHELAEGQHRCFLEEIDPLLAAEGIRLVRPKDLGPEQLDFLGDYFRRALLPTLTPLAIDPGHPFPHLSNRSLCLVTSIRPATPSMLPHATLAVVHIPAQVVPRFVALPAPPGQHAFALLEDVIRLHLPLLFRGYEVLSCHAIRVTRDAEFEIGRERAADLLSTIEAGLRGPWRLSARTSCTGSCGTRRTARRASGCARSRAASGGTATSPPGTTTREPVASTATSGCSPVAIRSARTSPSCSTC